MPRKPRIMSSTGIYHIILRSVNQHIIFEDDSDYQKFLFVLSDCVKKYNGTRGRGLGSIFWPYNPVPQVHFILICNQKNCLSCHYRLIQTQCLNHHK